MLILLVFAAVAQEGPTLETYLAAAVENNPRADIASASVATARAEAMKAGAALLPTVRASASWTRNQYEAIAEFPNFETGETEEIVISPLSQTDAAITARVPIFDGPALARWRASVTGTEVAAADQAVAIGDLRLEVSRAWYAAVAAQEVITAAERAKLAAAENVRYLSARAAAGVVTALAVQRAELELANAERLVTDGRRGWIIARRSLASLSGLPQPDSLPVAPASLEPAAPLPDALAGAESRSEIVAAQARVDQLRLARSASVLGWAPALSATASERYTNASGFSGENASWTVGLQADWLLLEFGDRWGDVQRARAALASAEATLEATRVRVRDEVEAAWLDVDAAIANVVASRRGSAVASATATEVQTRFQAGTATQLDVIQSDRDALNAELARIRAEGELSVARFALARAANR